MPDSATCYPNITLYPTSSHSHGNCYWEEDTKCSELVVSLPKSYLVFYIMIKWAKYETKSAKYDSFVKNKTLLDIIISGSISKPRL